MQFHNFFHIRLTMQFQNAMFGKRVWKHLTNSCNLIIGLFKAKYFCRGGFLKSNTGYNPNYV